MTPATEPQVSPGPSGLTSDFGWGSPDDTSALHGIGSAVLLLAATGAYCASVWLALGFPPLHHLALRVRRSRSRVPALPVHP